MGPATPECDLGQTVYLSTLNFAPEWLDDLRTLSPQLRVIQHTCASAADIPGDLWREVHVLHTNQVLPHPEQAPNLSWVQLDTSGIDHIVDSAIWRNTSIPVTTIGGVSARWIAEYIVMMLLAFSHRLPDLLDLQRHHHWPDPADRWRLFLPSPLAGTTVVIVGFGRIGRATGTMCAALGMHVVGVRRAADDTLPGPELPPIGTGFVPGSLREVASQALPEVVADADFVVVTAPLTAQTRGLLSRPVIEAMKPGAAMVNVSRGGVVNEQAVAQAMTAGHLRAAAFDVFAKEPLSADDPLWELPGMLITPHVAGFAGDYEQQVKALMAENVRRFLIGEELLNTASRAAGY